MKKRILSFMMAVVMVAVLLPVNPVQAAAEDVATAKGLVNSILSAAPTLEEYTGTRIEDQADNLVRLGTLLSRMSSSEKSELDLYIADATVIPGSSVSQSGIASRYTSIQRFYDDYNDAQDDYLDRRAAEVIAKIQDLMSAPLTREAFEEVEQMQTSYYIKDRIKSSDEGRSFEELQDLVEEADRADKAIANISNLIEEKDYSNFADKVVAAKNAVEKYYGEHANLRAFDKFKECLLRARRDDLLVNISKYHENLLIYDVEKTYHDLIDSEFEIMTDSVKKQLKQLSDALQAAKDSEFEIARNSFYNYDTPEDDRDIKTLLQWYDNIGRLEERLDALPDVPTDMISLARMMDAYDYYIRDLTQTEKAMVPEEYLDKMGNAVRLSTNSEDVVAVIDMIGALEGEEDFADFTARFDTAWDTYQGFLNRYRDVDGIVTLVTNREKLNEASVVQELIKGIRRLAAEPDASMCAQLAQMESLRLAYAAMSEDQKNQIYNIDVLNTIYADTQEAKEVASKIDNIRLYFTAKDEDTIRSIRANYEMLSDKAKGYVGESRLAALLLVEEQLAAVNKNAAELTIGLIRKIGTVSAESQSIIDAARSSYDSLTPTQKALVTNYTVLTAAERVYNAIDTNVAKAKVSGVRTYTYSGKTFKPVVSVTLNGTTLIPEIDYTVSYASNVNAGTARLRINGIGHYSGTLTKTFKIKAKKIKVAKVTGVKAGYYYTGKKIKPSMTVKDGKKVLVKGKDYKVKYSKNKKPGTASYTIQGKGNYTGKIKGTFRIVKRSK